jgi:hypothetical protein
MDDNCMLIDEIFRQRLLIGVEFWRFLMGLHRRV